MRRPFVNPFANPDHPLDVRAGKPIYARDVPDFVKPKEHPQDHPADLVPSRRKPRVIVPTGSVLYNNLDWEHPAYREAGQTEKKLLTYDKSLERLQAAGFERHARPLEVFGLLIDGLEGKLTGQQKAIYDNMLTSYGEWLDIAIEKKGDRLVAYLGLEGLRWNATANKYDVRGTLKCTEQRVFDITGRTVNTWIDLNQFSPDFVQYFYGRQFTALPEKMRVGNQRAQVALPSEGNIWPVGRGSFVGRFYIGLGNGRASRGVRAVAPKSP